MPKNRKQQVRKKKQQFTKFLGVFEKEVELQATEYNKKIAQMMAEEAKDIIERQLYTWQPLSEKYQAKKAREGLDPRTYVATGEFKDSIDWGEEGGKVWTGLPPGEIHEESGLPLTTLAKILEFGTSTIPPRPLWRPLLSKFIRSAPKLSRSYRAAVRRALKK